MVALMKRRGTLPLAALLLMLPALTTTACSKEEEATEALAALEADYSAEREALSESQDSLPEMSENPDSAERAAYRELLDARMEESRVLTNSFIPRYEALAKEYWGTGAGLEAKIWAMSRADQPTFGEDEGEEDREAAGEARAARIGEETDAIFETYAESPHMELLAESSYLFNDEQAEDYLGRLREDSPHANVRAAAIYYPASRKLSMLRIQEEYGSLPGLTDGDGDGEEGEDTEEETDPEEDIDPRAEIDADLQLLIDEYGDIPMGGSTYGAVAYAYLTAHTSEELAIGQPAPEIIGTDVDGNEIRLSQFLGQVVVLDFWGDW
jgi:hypothetical protein